MSIFRKEHFMSAEEAWVRFKETNPAIPDRKGGTEQQDYFDFAQLYADYVCQYEKYQDERCPFPAIEVFRGEDAKYATDHNRYRCGEHA